MAARDFVIPAPVAELRVLHGFALDGDMRSIREWANRLIASDRRFAPLLRRVVPPRAQLPVQGEVVDLVEKLGQSA